MIDSLNLFIILLAGLTAMASPGPATLAIAGTSVASGRRNGLALAAGVTTGSILWSVAAALGLGALMNTYGWAFTVLRYIGALYLLYLAFKSIRSALMTKPKHAQIYSAKTTLKGSYTKGLMLHLTNPKAVLFYGALYAIGIPQAATGQTLVVVIVSLGVLAAIIFHGYAIMFSSAALAERYVRYRRGFEAVFAIAFGGAALKILTTRLE